MTIGVEEEFILVDPSNYFYTPSAPKVLLKLLLKDKIYLNKSSLESPFGRGKFSYKKKDLMKGFSIVEVKTSPHKSIDSLQDEIIYHRMRLIEAVEDSNLALLPIGIHPLFSEDICGRESCAALHIHINNEEIFYHSILGKIPQIIALTANSPFINGKYLAMSSRALFSPSIGVPNNFYERKSDLIINRHFNTIELRICDTQLFSDDVIGAAATVLCIAKSSSFKEIKRSDYINQRQSAIYSGKQKIETGKLFEDIKGIAEELSLSDYVSKFFLRKTGAELQMECYNDNGLQILLPSLWKSMKKGRFEIDKSDIDINTSIKNNSFLYYLSIYSLIFMYNIIKKIRQDDAIHTTSFFGADPSKIVNEIFFD